MSGYDEGSQIVKDLLAGAIPVNPVGGNHYVTRDEFIATVTAIESKIETASAKTKLWFLGGCLSLLFAGGSGFVSVSNKLDRLSQSMPSVVERQNTRWPWVVQQQQRDLMQDETLKKLDKNYQPLPWQAPPN